MKRKFIPRGTWVLIDIINTEESTGGIILPGEAGEKRLVVAGVGAGVVDIEPGMEVFCNPGGSGWEFAPDSSKPAVKQMLAQAHDVIAFIKRAPSGMVS